MSFCNLAIEGVIKLINKVLAKIVSTILSRERKDRIRKAIYQRKYGLDIGIGTKIPEPEKITNKQVKIGRYTNLQSNVKIRGANKISIGNFCAIAEDVSIESTNHRTDVICIQDRLKKVYLDEKVPEKEEEEINIGNGVWIGRNVVILPGVEIGDGAVIGAGAVVTKDVDDFEIVGGVPASSIRYRFSKDIREKISEIQWWDWSLEEFKESELFSDKPIKQRIENL